jgi:hypothetical protein
MDENAWLPARIQSSRGGGSGIERWAALLRRLAVPAERAPFVRERDAG